MHQRQKIRKTTIFKRTIHLNGRRTSISLENEFWRSLHEIAADQNQSVSELVEQIDRERDNSNLSSSIRLSVFNHFRNAATRPKAPLTNPDTVPRTGHSSSVPSLSDSER
jgi:predicted DNA-binding ribbon-helix-helix protein